MQPPTVSGTGALFARELLTTPLRERMTSRTSASTPPYQSALHAEVDENGHRLVVHNSYHDEREVVTAAGR
jgi:hypothetical protein